MADAGLRALGRLAGWRIRVATILCAGLLGCTGLAAEQVLVERTSPYNRITVLEDGDGHRVMRFHPGDARQSVVRPGDPDHLATGYARAAPAVLLFAPRPASMLIIGLGGGTLPMFFRKHLPEIEIDVVDIDPVVIELARSHFGFVEDARMRAHAADGRAFVEKSRRGYDIVFLDAYGAEDLPFALATREFMEAVRRITLPQGVVISNIWGREANRQYDAMIATYRAVYGAVAVIDAPDSVNKLVIVRPDQPLPARAEVVTRARELTQRLALRHDLSKILGQGYRMAGLDGRGARVLTDSARPR